MYFARPGEVVDIVHRQSSFRRAGRWKSIHGICIVINIGHVPFNLVRLTLLISKTFTLSPTSSLTSDLYGYEKPFNERYNRSLRLARSSVSLPSRPLAFYGGRRIHCIAVQSRPFQRRYLFVTLSYSVSFVYGHGDGLGNRSGKLVKRTVRIGQRKRQGGRWSQRGGCNEW